MAVDIRFFSADENPGPAVANLPNTAVAGEILIVSTGGGNDGGGLDLPVITDNISGATGWAKLSDHNVSSSTNEFRTTKWWKTCVGGETAVTFTLGSGANMGFIAAHCRGLGSLNEVYVIGEGQAQAHFTDLEYGWDDGGALHHIVPSSNGEVYLGCTTMSRAGYSFAAFTGTPDGHDNNGVGGSGFNQGNAIAGIIHIDDTVATNATSDQLRYGSRPTDHPVYDTFLGIRVQAAVAPANTVAPAVTGTAKVGQTLSTTDGTWTGTPSPTFTYAWKAGGVAIGGATASTFLLTNTQHGALITCTVTATNTAGSASATSNATVAVVYANPVNDVAPAITGEAKVGQTLSCSTGTWTGTGIAYTYAWKLGDGTPIGGATASTFKLTNAQRGLTVKCTVTATNDGAAVTATSSATAAVGSSALPPWILASNND